jgi:hypothetical protein
MKSSKGWFGVSLVILLFSILAGCATPPTKEETAALDYGACPKDHEKWIKERFQSGLISAYAGEPTIWPPQRYSYRDPFLGSTVGYLVPVMADLTRGNRMFLGRQLYGFMFRNGEMVREINPNIMRNLKISTGIGPFPKDERDWKEGHTATSANPIVIEYVLPGETVQNWTELVTLLIVSNVSLNVDATRFAADVEAQHRSRKPGCALVAQRVLSSNPTSVLYEQSLVNCAPFRDEFSIRKAIRGPTTISEVSYAKTSKLTDLEKKKWVEIVGRTVLLDECSKP